MQKEIKSFPVPERVADIEYVAAKSEDEVLKVSFAFEKETWQSREL